MKRRSNSAKERFLGSLKDLPDITVDTHVTFFKEHLSFSFRYFESSQTAGQDFAGWTQPQLVKLLNKLKEYSKNTLLFWQNERIGGSGLRVLAIYNKFPSNSGFTHPRFVPDDVLWARFRLEQSVRLCGFLLPDDKVREHDLRKNVFYIVFLDLNHQFYLTEDQ